MWLYQTVLSPANFTSAHLKTTFHGRWKKLIVDFHRGNFGNQVTEETLFDRSPMNLERILFTHFLDRNSTRYGIRFIVPWNTCSLI